MSKKNKEETMPMDNQELETEQTEAQENVAEAVDEKDAKINALEEELAAQKDKYMRLAAEYDNYRKRTANEKLSIYDDATAKAVVELLPIADSVEMAIANLKDASTEILKGIELISNQLAKSFEKLKITAYGKKGDAFDPNIHNAISKIEDEELGENTLAQVYQTGYKLGDKVIRHAMVVVANCD